MEVEVLKEKKLNEKELKNVISEYPELLMKDLKTLASELSVDNGRGRVDLVFQKGHELVLLETKADSTFMSLYQAAYYYNCVKRDFNTLKEFLNVPKVRDLSVIVVMSHFPDWYIGIVKLFKIEFPLRLFTYKAYENEDGKLSVFFHEKEYKENVKHISKGSKVERVKSVSLEDNLEKSEARAFSEKFINEINENFDGELKVESKNWGYSVKNNRKVVLTITFRKKNSKIETFDHGEWISDTLSLENYSYYMDCLTTIMENSEQAA